jgi:perosamine synthetase
MGGLIPHNRPLITADDRAAVDAVLSSGWIAQGPAVEALEASFVGLYGGGGACAVSSGTAALFLALKSLGGATGSIVAVPTYACSALLNAVYMAGASRGWWTCCPTLFASIPMPSERMLPTRVS